MNWKKASWIAIEAGFRECLAKGVRDPEVIADHINHECYPFGERKYTPYKVWCDSMREFRAKLPSLIDLKVCQQTKKEKT